MTKVDLYGYFHACAHLLVQYTSVIHFSFLICGNYFYLYILFNLYLLICIVLIFLFLKLKHLCNGVSLLHNIIICDNMIIENIKYNIITAISLSDIVAVSQGSIHWLIYHYINPPVAANPVDVATHALVLI